MPLTVVPNIWGRVLGRLARVPVIVGNCRGGGAPRRQHERWLWPLAHHLCATAAALKTVLTRRYGVPEARITVIPNGVDTDYFRPGPGRRRGLIPPWCSVGGPAGAGQRPRHPDRGPLPWRRRPFPRRNCGWWGRGPWPAGGPAPGRERLCRRAGSGYRRPRPTCGRCSGKPACWS